jgi:polygalacturonase
MADRENPRRSFMTNSAVALAVGAFAGSLKSPGTENHKAGTAATSYDVKVFGAKGDGKTLDSAAINHAIQAASDAGGGAVVFPAGTYACFSIRLKSNVTLQLAPGAIVLAADSFPDGTGYDPAEPNPAAANYQDFGHSHWHNSLIWGDGLENVSIVGSGLIWGKGLSRGGLTEDEPGPKAEDPGVGNKAIALKNCHNIVLRDFAILHGGHFGILATGVDNLTIENLRIDTNRDGMDIDCCRNVRISNCSVNSPWDDGLCLKSSYALGYARVTEMVTITNCMVSGDFEEGTLLDATYKHFAPNADVGRAGRIKFGTETIGGFKNITISNCVFDGCHGLALESVDGALFEDVTITNITMRDIVAGPIFLRLGARMRSPAGTPVGKLRRVNISNIVCSNASGSLSSIISGIPGHEIEDLTLSNILIQHRGGGAREDAARKVEDEAKRYPDPNMFGITPSHGFFIRHVRGLVMNDIKIEYLKEDARPAFVLDAVQQAEFFDVHTPHTAGNSVFTLNNVKDFSIARSNGVPDTSLDNGGRDEL